MRVLKHAVPPWKHTYQCLCGTELEVDGNDIIFEKPDQATRGKYVTRCVVCDIDKEFPLGELPKIVRDRAFRAFMSNLSRRIIRMIDGL